MDGYQLIIIPLLISKFGYNCEVNISTAGGGTDGRVGLLGNGRNYYEWGVFHHLIYYLIYHVTHMKSW